MCAPYVEARPKGDARAEKEIGEKAQKIIRYQIVSTYFLHGAFKVLFSALRPVFSRLFGLIMCTFVLLTEHPEDLFTLYVMRVQKKKWANLRVFSLFIVKNRVPTCSRFSFHQRRNLRRQYSL